MDAEIAKQLQEETGTARQEQQKSDLEKALEFKSSWMKGKKLYDLEKLWDLVKKMFSSTEPTIDKEKVVWVELKRLFEPDNDDTLWKLQRYMHDPLKSRLYDICGVHHVSTERGHDIFMLVKKDYPLKRALMTVMLANKLQVDASSEMENEILRKIFYQVIQVGEITIGELRKKLKIFQKEKDGIQFSVDKFENASKSLNKIIECQIVDNCKKGLGYNAVPPPYTGNFMPPTPDLSFTGLDEFVNMPVVENSKAKSGEEEPKEVRKNDDAPIIE
ncbi:hypothetical protein Tco_0611803 [Tanacetum coccineum]